MTLSPNLPISSDYGGGKIRQRKQQRPGSGGAGPFVSTPRIDAFGLRKNRKGLRQDADAFVNKGLMR
jgi:hypothetical protein